MGRYGGYRHLAGIVTFAKDHVWPPLSRRSGDDAVISEGSRIVSAQRPVGRVVAVVVIVVRDGTEIDLSMSKKISGRKRAW